eukprot:NODE_3878_length_880_cov_29.660027_g3725_i0.p1 GENE.NODE_3878_length_880_cov_29.660027_g3725_i0~~NODE_3878_length_880_cov_29.660027_g3725_i0.p1  ORF type:complete len:279 (+),score=71.51 NODE_3878_length_880_cov_29.660027_g3725_i0:48-839(+)
MAKTAAKKAASAVAQAKKVPGLPSTAPQEPKKNSTSPQARKASPVDLTKAPVKPTQKLKRLREGQEAASTTPIEQEQEPTEQQSSRIVYVPHLPERVTKVQLLELAPNAQLVKVLAPNKKHYLPEQVMTVHFPTAEQACEFAEQGTLEIAGAQCPLIVAFSSNTEGCWRCMERGHSHSTCQHFYQRMVHFSNKYPVAEHKEVVAEFGEVEDIFYCPGKGRAVRSLLFPTKALAEAAIAKQTVTIGGRKYRLKADNKLNVPKVA